jgi:3-oxoadipate enol-lactonase
MSVAVHHRLDGPEDAPVLVLSNSLGTTHAMWDDQLPALAERFRVLRYDMRGHGDSPVPPGPYSIDDLGGDVLALLDRLGLERASFCGLSIGGMTGMWLAARAPERVERLAVCCTSAHLPGDWHERAATVRAEGVAAVADAALGRWLTPGFRERRPDVVERLRRMLLGTDAEGYASSCEAIAAMDLRSELGSIRAPTLVIAAEDDPATPPEHGRLIEASVPDARLVVVPDARHLANVERAEDVTPLLLEHLTAGVSA